MARFVRLVRVYKLNMLLKDALRFINSPSLVLTIGIVKLMFSLCLTNHIIGCCWYGVGVSSRIGWVTRTDIERESVLFRYLESLQWSLGQFQGSIDTFPGTVYEKLFGVVFLLFAVLAMASFLSSLTNHMRQLQIIHDDQHVRQRVLCMYLQDHRIS